jgi:hypothetical protein
LTGRKLPRRDAFRIDRHHFCANKKVTDSQDGKGVRIALDQYLPELYLGSVFDLKLGALGDLIIAVAARGLDISFKTGMLRVGRSSSYAPVPPVA